MAQPELVREINQRAVLNVLRQQKFVSRTEVGRQLGLTRPTVADITSKLASSGLVMEDGIAEVGARGGRPAAVLRLNPDGASFLGAHFSSDHVTVVAMNLAGDIVMRHSEQFPLGTGLDVILETLTTMVRDIVRKHRHQLPALRGMGASVPGIVHEDGEVTFLPRDGWGHVDLRDRLLTQLDLPVVLDNDGTASAIAEIVFGSEEVADDLLFLILDSGVGGGMMVRRAPYRGASGLAGEVGHIKLDVSGPACAGCGGNGCLDSLVNSQALERYHAEFAGTGRDRRFPEIIERWRSHDEAATRAVDVWLTWLRRGIESLVFVVDPAQLVLGGSVPVAMPELVELVHGHLAQNQILGRRGMTVRLARFGPDGGAIAGAALLYHQFFSAAEGRPAPMIASRA